MVSLWSLFSGRRKSKTRSRSSSPSNGNGNGAKVHDGGRPGSVSPPPRGSRFLSVRSRSTDKGPPKIPRRASSNTATPPGATTDGDGGIRRLELGWEKTAGEETFKDVTARPVLTAEEVRSLEMEQMKLEAITEGWKIFGKALREMGVSTPGIFISSQGGSKQLQYYLIALFLLSLDPVNISSFKSIASHLPSKPSSAQLRERLMTHLPSASPVDLAEILKWTLRHHASNPTLVLSSEGGIKSLKYELGLQCDTEPYSTILSRDFAPHAPEYLDEIFEVCAAVVIHSSDNGLTAGKICHLLGMWVLGEGMHRYKEWRDLYKYYQEAGRTLESLFYAWIRHRSDHETLPGRLLALIDNSTSPKNGSPQLDNGVSSRPDDASNSRMKSLDVWVSSDEPVFGTPITQEAVKAALKAPPKEGEDLPLWTELRRAMGSPTTGEIDELILSDSLGLFRSSWRDEPSSSTASKPRQSSTPTSTSHNKSQTHSRKRSQSHGDIPHLHQGSHLKKLDSLSEELSLLPHARPPLAEKQSTRQARSASAFSTWDDFTKSGFSPEENSPQLDLSLSPVSTSAAALPAPDPVPTPDTDSPAAQPTASSEPPELALRVIAASEVEIDDSFMYFLESASNTITTLNMTSPLIVLRLDNSKVDTPFAFLFLNFHQTIPLLPAPAPPETASAERPISPSGRSTTSRMSSMFSFRDLTSKIRRSSSSNPSQEGSSASRKSVSGSTTRTLGKSNTAAAGLATLAESPTRATDGQPPVSAAPTQYTIGELGKVVTVDAKPETGSAVDPIPLAEEAKKPPASTSGLSRDTPWEEWVYSAEGAAHAVFAYIGSNPSYVGKVIRIQKVADEEDKEYAAARQGWSEELLPRLLPKEWLVSSQRIALDEEWLKAMLSAAEEKRPRKRKESGFLRHRISHAELMENLLHVGSTVEGETSVVIEIKPKWGFLPSAEHIRPPEAAEIKSKNCRYCLHQHYRGVEVAEGEVKYCPLDLYSKKEQDVRRAIAGLWSIWKRTNGAGNNWRVYFNGEAVSPVGDREAEVDRLEHSRAFTNHLIDIFAVEGVFERLRRLQSSLDPIDISGIVQLTAGDPSFAKADVSEPSLAELRDIVQLVSQPGGSSSAKADNWTPRQRIVAYALSAIFKDCSVFVKTSIRIHGDDVSVVNGTTSIRVIDLDLKPVGRIAEWAALDEKIWKHWAANPPTSDPTKPDPVFETPRIWADGNTSPQFETPLRPRAVADLSHLTAATNDAASERDNASTRAMFVPTPRESRPETPLESPFVPRAKDEGSAVARASEETEDLEGVSLEDALGISPPQVQAARSRVSMDLPAPPEHTLVEGGAASVDLEKLHPTDGPEASKRSSGVLDVLVDNAPVPRQALESPVDDRRQRSAAPSPASELVQLPTGAQDAPEAPPMAAAPIEASSVDALAPPSRIVPEPTPSLISDHGSVASSPVESLRRIPLPTTAKVAAPAETEVSEQPTTTTTATAELPTESGETTLPREEPTPIQPPETESRISQTHGETVPAAPETAETTIRTAPPVEITREAFGDASHSREVAAIPDITPAAEAEPQDTARPAVEELLGDRSPRQKVSDILPAEPLAPLNHSTSAMVEAESHNPPASNTEDNSVPTPLEHDASAKYACSVEEVAITLMRDAVANPPSAAADSGPGTSPP